MSLTSYRTAPPRVTDIRFRSDPGNRPQKRLRGPIRPRWVYHLQPAEPRSHARGGREILKEALPAISKNDGQLAQSAWQTWQRSTLPCLKTQYHRRWGT